MMTSSFQENSPCMWSMLESVLTPTPGEILASSAVRDAAEASRDEHVGLHLDSASCLQV